MSVDARWLGHATTVIHLDGVAVLTDPLLNRHAGVLRRRGPAPRPEQWSGTDAVLVSHLHHDHAQRSSLARVAGTPVLSAVPNAAWLRRRGVAATGLEEGRWHPVPGTSLRVRLTRADHAHRPMPHRPNAAHGHLLVGPSARVWFAGDTSLYDEMAELPAVAGGPIDLALVPVGGWGPRLSGGHMDAEDAARACALTGARAAIPVHWGTLHPPGAARRPPGWMDRPGPAFVEALARHAPRCRAHLLRPGEQAQIGAGLLADDEGG